MLFLSSVVVVFRNVSLRVKLRSLIIWIIIIIWIGGKISEAVPSKSRVNVAEVVSGIHRVSLAVVRITVVIPSFLF